MRIFIHPNPLRYFLLSVTIAIVTFGLIFSSCTDYEQESVPVPDRTAVIYLNFKTGASSKPAAGNEHLAKCRDACTDATCYR